MAETIITHSDTFMTPFIFFLILFALTNTISYFLCKKYAKTEDEFISFFMAVLLVSIIIWGLLSRYVSSTVTEIYRESSGRFKSETRACCFYYKTNNDKIIKLKINREYITNMSGEQLKIIPVQYGTTDVGYGDAVLYIDNMCFKEAPTPYFIGNPIPEKILVKYRGHVTRDRVEVRYICIPASESVVFKQHVPYF